jgi:hypothetical protein
MLRSGTLIRLTRAEAARLAHITGMEPRGIRTLEDLQAYARCCKVHYWGVSADTRFLHWLIDEEIGRLAAAA